MSDPAVGIYATAIGGPIDDPRLAWLQEQVAGGAPDVDVYDCSCGLWTVALAGTPDVTCECGKAPTLTAQVRRSTAAPGTEAVTERSDV